MSCSCGTSLSPTRPSRAGGEPATGVPGAGVPFILNDRPDLAVSAGADGVHVGQDDAHPAAARQMTGPDALVGLSTHSSTELGRALGDATAAAAIDYVSAGPVVPTPTKPGRPGTGLGYVADAVRVSPWPVWITGGVSPSSVPELVAAVPATSSSSAGSRAHPTPVGPHGSCATPIDEAIGASTMRPHDHGRRPGAARAVRSVSWRPESSRPSVIPPGPPSGARWAGPSPPARWSPRRSCPGRR